MSLVGNLHHLDLETQTGCHFTGHLLHSNTFPSGNSKNYSSRRQAENLCLLVKQIVLLLINESVCLQLTVCKLSTARTHADSLRTDFQWPCWCDGLVTNIATYFVAFPDLNTQISPSLCFRTRMLHMRSCSYCQWRFLLLCQNMLFRRPEKTFWSSHMTSFSSLL